MGLVIIDHTPRCRSLGAPFPLGRDRVSCGRCRRKAHRVSPERLERARAATAGGTVLAFLRAIAADREVA